MYRPHNHLPHVLLLVHAVERLRSGKVSAQEILVPPQLFVVEDGEKSFWELVGIAIEGVPSLTLGALRFRRQSAAPENHSRESLVSYLSSPVREIGIRQAPTPHGLIEMRVPDTSKPIIQWLKDCRAGQVQTPILVHRDDILFAFDFRVDNPSRSHHREALPGGSQRYLFRTTAGHVLSALPHRLPSKLHRDDPFLALTRATQHTATQDRPLPTLVVHRRYLTMTVPIDDDATEWLHRTQPFHTDLANPSHLLDAELDQYRLYRQRESLGNIQAPPAEATALAG